MPGSNKIKKSLLTSPSKRVKASSRVWSSKEYLAAFDSLAPRRLYMETPPESVVVLDGPIFEGVKGSGHEYRDHIVINKDEGIQRVCRSFWGNALARARCGLATLKD